MEKTEPLRPREVCSMCHDKHRVFVRSDSDTRIVLCTHCPKPCEKCRQRGSGAYCEKTPCVCPCHYCQTCGRWRGLREHEGECPFEWSGRHAEDSTKPANHNDDREKQDALVGSAKKALQGLYFILSSLEPSILEELFHEFDDGAPTVENRRLALLVKMLHDDRK